MSILLTLAAAAALRLEVSSSMPQDMSPAIAQCISDNAPKVEQAIASLNDGTSFLVDDLCAGVIAEEAARQSKAAMQRLRDEQHAKCLDEQKAPKPASTEDDAAGACSFDKFYSTFSATYADQPGYTLFAPQVPEKIPQATAYAAKLLLDLRLAHAKP